MSTLNPGATTTRRSAVDVSAPVLESVTIRWSLSRHALRAAKPGIPILAGLSEHGPDLELRWKLNLDDSRAVATLADAGADQVLAQASCRHTIDGDLIHVECADGSLTLLSATLRVGDGDARVLYATTALLAKLGLGGGRYEVM
jgi:hypothetical protein